MTAAARKAWRRRRPSGPPALHTSSPRRRASLLRGSSVAGQVFVLEFLLVVALVAIAVVAMVLSARTQVTADARHRARAVAAAFAQSPGVAEAMTRGNPTAVLQPRAEAARKTSGVDSVVVFNTRGIRLTHPQPELIGKRIVGPAAQIRKELAGQPITETFHASQGRSVISAFPVTGPGGKFLGGVSVGVKIKSVNSEVDQRLPVLLGAAGGTLVVAAGGTTLVSRRVRRQTHGLAPAEMTRMYEHHDAVLHAVREGVLILDGDGRLLLVNDEARRLLQLAPDIERRHVSELGLEPHLEKLLASGRTVSDEVHPSGTRLLAVNIRSTGDAGTPTGTVATLRDTTELRVVAGRAEVARERLELLYDAGVRIGSTLELTGTAEALAEVAVPRFADVVTVELLDPVERGEEPSPPHEAEVLRRTAVGGVPEGHPLFRQGEQATYAPSAPQLQALRTGQAVLRTDLSDTSGWPAGYGPEALRLLDHGMRSLITVPLRYRGVTLGLANFWRTRRSELFEDDDVAIAGELAARTAVCVDNARRFTREHAMVVTLRRNLLPYDLPEQDAVEVASRYLPAQAGGGGGWFDVIPLPGARVALVVGSAVGQGLHATATMGRLRTAVQNFSALDLPPDEVLSLLDELVTRVDLERGPSADSSSIAGSTCLYAIYDPVAGHCTVARAGHPAPALLGPDGTVDIPEVPLGPPLGKGREPVETAEFSLPDATSLILHTHGLLAHDDQDRDTSLRTLRHVLATAPDRSPEETCRSLLDNVLPPRPADDVALLVARTRLLDPKHVAEWEVPFDPAAVAPLRAECGRHIEAWGLEEAAFNAELIISELITNAIRYGVPPVRLRLLHGRTLICEVSDGSSTAPHLRRARTTDEGGRGLFLVSQFAQRWGTRYTTRGKVIWAEQALHDTPAGDDATGDSLLGQWDVADW
ncbi:MULTISPECIES: SpoIIE family protein phosphatase [Streptomyces]|uniref:SpoIIE family protein phosphatase n=1 Tax=Streptomyces lonegramiae TaxID=3075524 RepID=A0ABU2XBM7_9ACTN|nr:SpoIIE family protein phosphatase [Streptomyces sp. DSM 41529]MDT0542955.1 SpoIIE family protein phosphatase [Streptomyces sp. DSM 41529]